MKAKSSKVKWAIAGRSKKKLEDLKKEISREVENLDMMDVDVIIADSSNIDTLYDVVKDSRSVASTVGPYALYGRFKFSFSKLLSSSSIMTRFSKLRKYNHTLVIPTCLPIFSRSWRKDHLW